MLDNLMGLGNQVTGWVEGLDKEKLGEWIKAQNLANLVKKEEIEEKKKNRWVCILAGVGIVAAVAAIGYFIYRLVTPDYIEDFDDEYDDFEDDFDDDYFEED